MLFIKFLLFPARQFPILRVNLLCFSVGADLPLQFGNVFHSPFSVFHLIAQIVKFLDCRITGSFQFSEVCQSVFLQVNDRPCHLLEIENFRPAGAEVKRGKHLAFKIPNGKRFVRCDSLGDDYTEAAIMVSEILRIANEDRQKFRNFLVQSMAVELNTI